MRTEFPLGLAIANNGKNGSESLSRFSVPLLMLLVTLIWASPSMAVTYYVGTCKTGGYPTISSAIANAVAGSTIKICPGTYAENLFINEPLTLQGMLVGDSSLVLIQPPSLAPSESSIKFGTVYPEVFVNAGPVNLSDLTIGKTSCPSSSLLADIFYSNGFGTINHVSTQSSYCTQYGEVAILLENGTSTVSTTTVENSNIWEPQTNGIYTCSTPSRSVVKVTDNYIYQTGNWGVAFDCNTAGTATGNFGDITGMATYSPGSVFSGNSLTLGSYGIYVAAPGAKIESNRFYSSGCPVCLYSDGATVTGNKFMFGEAINFNCYTATVTGNTFVGGTVGGSGSGYAYAPASFKSSDSLFNVPTVYYGSCP